jgi:hypothetical protein
MCTTLRSIRLLRRDTDFTRPDPKGENSSGGKTALVQTLWASHVKGNGEFRLAVTGLTQNAPLPPQPLRPGRVSERA